MTLTDLSDICARVSRFQRKNNWQLKAPAIVAFEFSTISDFMAAKADLTRMIHAEPMYAHEPTKRIERAIDPCTIELDCYGVTFRLKCMEIYHVQGGRPVGAAEMTEGKDFQLPPSSFLRGLANFRKFGSSY